MDKKSLLLYCTFCILISFVLSMFVLGTFVNTTFIDTIVVTDDAKQAQMILEVLSEYSQRAEIVKEESKYRLVLLKDKNNKWKCTEILLALAEKGLITPAVHFDRQIEYKNNNEQFEKILNIRLNGIINQMEGVSVRMSVCGGDEKSCKSSCGRPIISVYIDVDEDADKTYIEKVSKTIVLASVKDFPSENIKIEFVNQNKKMPEARKLYKQKKYDEVFKLFSKHPENYEMSIRLLTKLIELDKKISQNPNDYYLYVERADIKAVPVYATLKYDFQGVTSDYQGAIADYTKALLLNPKAYELYEKRGDAHIDSSFVDSFTDEDVSREKERSLAIKDYENAIKYTDGNDRLFEKLGNEYYSRKDYNNAYRIYSMISREYIINENNEDLIYKVINCFAQVEEYDKAIELCDEGIKNIKVKELVRRLKLTLLNLKVRRLFLHN